jgi:TIR domain
MSHVFISYRRSDAGPEAGRLADSLKLALRKGSVFRDIGGIDAGAFFDQILERELRRATHVIVLIGPGWLKELNRRLVLPEVDFVRVEVATSLAAGKVVIPVMLRNAEPPPYEDLPEDLVGLFRPQASNLRDDVWQYDVQRLLDSIGRPYRFGALALRCFGAFAVIGTCVTLAARSENLDFRTVQFLFWSSLLVYIGAEVAAFVVCWRKRQR